MSAFVSRCVIVIAAAEKNRLAMSGLMAALVIVVITAEKVGKRCPTFLPFLS